MLKCATVTQKRGDRMKKVKVIKVEQLKEERQLQKLSQKEVAERAGIDRSTLTCYELGLRKPPIDVLQKLAAALNVKFEIGGK